MRPTEEEIDRMERLHHERMTLTEASLEPVRDEDVYFTIPLDRFVVRLSASILPQHESYIAKDATFSRALAGRLKIDASHLSGIEYRVERYADCIVLVPLLREIRLPWWVFREERER